MKQRLNFMPYLNFVYSGQRTQAWMDSPFRSENSIHELSLVGSVGERNG
jgi:hypothetical protein